MDKEKLIEWIKQEKQDNFYKGRSGDEFPPYEVHQEVLDDLLYKIEKGDFDIAELGKNKGWTSVDDELPKEKGKYLVTYHPCYWDVVREQVLVGTDTFRGKNVWAKYKYQRNTHWMEIPEAATEETKEP